ncbi:TPA: hypothetical protein NH712_001419 [Pseudomonas aeruginosa]|nr:hypothetical protein [Pseudomonas aeruginosa]MCS7821934.1 hypothetical protein [Pseudomonas aeruginosa]HCF0768809.1 hypothetical protein [Pseudomonas aeruginosa]HCL3771952.1 hypothetical protein [Pseudomonas aeruginosa]
MSSRWSEWYFRDHARNKAKKAAQMRDWRSKNKDKSRKQSRESKDRLRERIFDLYGHTCVLCGFDNKIALTLDHVTGNGNQERKALGERGVYMRAVKEYLPDEYRTLCMNCQFIERERIKSADQIELDLFAHPTGSEEAA